MQKFILILYVAFASGIVYHNYTHMLSNTNNFPCRIVSSSIYPCGKMSLQHDICEKGSDGLFTRSYILDGMDYHNSTTASDWHMMGPPYSNAAYMYFMMFIGISTTHIVISYIFAIILDYMVTFLSTKRSEVSVNRTKVETREVVF